MSSSLSPPNLFPDNEPISANETRLTRPEIKTDLNTSNAPLLNGSAPHSSLPGQMRPERHVNDLVLRIPGMYRILDLISEQGSGGMVDKVIIDQEGLKNLVNDLSPGAYTAVTKVDFKALDNLPVQPLGIYGDKGEIARFLASLSSIDDQMFMLLANSKDETKPSLRSGIYLIRPPNLSSDLFYAVYWPQDQTWRDDAPSGPRRNRITFMRYLTKIADQIVCLMSHQQGLSFVWDHQDQAKEKDDSMDDEDDRLFSFEITKRNEQDESVVSHPGFSITSELMRRPDHPDEAMQVDSGDLQMSSSPRLLNGEITQGFLTAQLIPPRLEEKPIDEVFTSMRLRQLLSTTMLKVTCELSDHEVIALVENGLGNRYPRLCNDWRAERNRIFKESEKLHKDQISALRVALEGEEKVLSEQLKGLLVKKVIEKYPTLDPGILSGTDQLTHEDLSQRTDDLTEFCQSFGESSVHELRKFEKALSAVESHDFKKQKKRLVCIQIIKEDYPDQYKDKLVDIIEYGVPQKMGRDKTSILKTIGSKLGLTHSDTDKFDFRLDERCEQYWDAEFLANLDDMLKMVPETESIIKKAIAEANNYSMKTISRAFGAIFRCVQTALFQMRRKSVDEQIDAQKAEDQKRSRALLFEQIEKEPRTDSPCTVILKEFKILNARYYAQEYKITATEQRSRPSVYEYHIHKLEIPSDHRHNLQLDPKFVPKPTVNQKDSVSFELPPSCNILHVQLLAENRVLLVVEDQHHFSIYLENISSIGNAVNRQSSKRVLHKDKLGKDVLITYDESKRLLVFCASHKLILHIFAFDETLGNLQSWGRSFELASWYNNGAFIHHITFVTGTEDLLLVDSLAQARIFSLVTQRFRPASLSLPHVPTFVLSSPDGACALIIHHLRTEQTLSAFHWDTFGATEGITIPLHSHNGGVVVTSFVNRKSVHIMTLDEEQGICNSVALDITKRSSEFTFQEKGTKVTRDPSRSGQYINNCMMDCFADVWTRFPVAAAVTRRSIMLSTSCRPRVTFSTDYPEQKFALYFSDLVETFVNQTKKPTGGQLEGTIIDAQPFPDLLQNKAYTRPETVSKFRAGEWLANLLCLIPIHIAVARENRFIPLKDGVTSADFERSLLGAEVGRIVDSLSFGWYESILRSYMADKPVKVVSSMGEQSVGKSFSLNHLMDTSFAGSAMRTTEGVWMSVTPTDDALLVALDFEGVHSIERSPQEDALLVLFNTAISNLVLFRNNFAISRDIAGLFQSFQASSAILDPGSNPSLFQSTLVIIIKDVVESDKREIVREFSLKFQKIVEEEQAANFISRLHAGRLNIIPWPVIESHQFYSLFPALKRRLDSQMITHPSAGEFLLTLKILMAKLKANDWGAMSQSLASHRVQTLLAMLPTALEYGMAEIHPDVEPLKNLDNDTVVDSSDTLYRFFTSHSSEAVVEREHVLMQLQKTWEKFNTRNIMAEEDWIHGLDEYLENLAKLRLSHVDDWVSINLRRFKNSGSSVEVLQRQLANDIVDLRANIELCKMTCAKCHLSCTLSRRHDPTQSPHDCTTNHQCSHSCDFGDDHPTESRGCGSPAGHSGPHICIVEEHLCGEPCLYKDKKGCQGECMQTAGHTGEHICAARKHVCGKPCELQVKSINYRCPGTCDYPSDEDHEHHICDNRMCPVSCQLCKRLCGNHDHLHGLSSSATHLCGETHPCNALCNADGICQIDTAPHSIEATFTGRHETFQYTKYTQVAKRLPCVKTIPAGRLDHDGRHIHSTDKTVFHYCETKCPSCGYYCTSPRGHPQQEHDTSHGSMSSTRWAIDGRDNTVELNGRRFGANDDGAPMMCSMVCQSMGRHIHIDYCRTDANQPCRGADHEHISTRLSPNPDQPKDWITHALFWRRSGFRDPYSREDQANFAKCDSMCSGPEHVASANQTAQPSYCTLPIFHPPHATNRAAGLGYVSNDGHLFSCKNPAVLQQAFHVIFVIDRSGSMSSGNSAPLPLTPVRNLIVARHNNRLGAVYSALYGFWHDRQVALNTSAANSSSPIRRDSYSVILFESYITRCIENDFQRTPDNLLNALLQYNATGGTNYEAAIQETESLMRRHWSTERTPIVIFLSDGECSIRDDTMRNLCRASIALGKPLSFHSVSFGPNNHILRRMAQIAREVEATAPRDPLLHAAAHVASSYAEALDSVRLAETFLGIAESLRKTRGSLIS